MIFAYTNEFSTEPLAAALERRGWQTVMADKPEELLLAGAADLVMTSPLEYARTIGVIDFALAPGVAISTSGFAGLVKLMFKQHLVTIGLVAVSEPDSFGALLARVILSEKHDIEPHIVRVPDDAPVEEMLSAADIALLAGDRAVFDGAGRKSLLDLTDEWEDLAEAPLPYRIVWGRIDQVSESALALLREARDEAVLTLADRAVNHPNAEAAQAFYQHYLRGEIRYTLADEDLEALDTFYRYLFYYGLISDIPALKYLPAGSPAGPAPATPSIAPPQPPSDGAPDGDGNMNGSGNEPDLQ